ALEVYSGLFIHHLRHYFRSALENFSFIDYVDTLIDIASIGNLAGLCRYSHLFAERIYFQLDIELFRSAWEDLHGRPELAKTSAPYADAVVSRSNRFKHEAAFVIGAGCAEDCSLRTDERNLNTDDCGSLGIFNCTGDLPWRFLSSQWETSRYNHSN